MMTMRIRLLAGLLCLWMAFGCLATGSAIFAAEDPMQVEFLNDLPGSAAGTVRFSGKNGKYNVYWGNEAGEKLTVALGARQFTYSSLGKLTVSGGTGALTFQPFTAIPEGARQLILSDGSDNVVGRYTIPAAKLPQGEMKYAYGVISDVHFNYKDYGKSEDAAATALRNALALYKDAGCKLVSVTGDIGVYGEKSSYTGFHNVAAEAGITVLACGGNHEVNGCREDVYGKDGKKGYWQTYMNAGVYDGTLEGLLEVAPNKVDFVYQIPGEEEIFVYLHQMHWDGRAAQGARLLNEDQMTWLEKTFAAYKDRTVILHFHTYLSDDDHDSKDGEGDLQNQVGAGYDYAYNSNAVEEAEFRKLLTENRNVIWYNGHSHFTYAMQRYNQNLNIIDYYGSTATMIHVPSVTAPRTMTDTGDSYDVHIGEASEGALTMVYDGYQVMNGVNLLTGEIESYASYVIYDDTTVLTEGDAGGVHWIYDKQLASLRLDGTGEVTVGVKELIGDGAPTLQTVYVGAGVEKLPDGFAKDCAALRRIEIKEGCTVLGAEAFAAATPDILSLPGSLQTVGKSCFASLTEKVDFLFAGTAAEYAALQIAEGNDSLQPDGYGSYLITWQIGDQSTQTKVSAGEKPICPATPIKAHEDPQKAWLFEGWKAGGKLTKASSSLPAAKADVTYVASFGEEVDRYVSGEVGKRGKWSLDRMYGTLTFSGSNTMPDCSSQTGYSKYKNEIYTVIVKKGLTSLGKGALARLPKLQTVVVEHGIKKLDMDCMAYVDTLQEIWLPKGISSVSQGALFNSDHVQAIYFEGKDTDWTLFLKHVTNTYNDNLIGAGNVIYNSSSPTAQTYTVTFRGEDGTTLYTAEKVGWNQSAVFGGTLPTVEGKHFAYWDGLFTNVRSDMTVTAVYEADEPTKPAEEEKTSETSATSDEPGKPKENNLPLILGISGGAVVVIGAAVAVIVKAKKKKSNGN